MSTVPFPSLPCRLAVLLIAALVGGSAAAEPLDGGNAKRNALIYYHKHFYEQDLEAIGLAAQAWVRWRAPYATKPALVLDIDETALSNWPQILANNFANVENGPCRLPQGPCGRLAWDGLALAKAIRPTLDLFRAAQASGVAVFFITGRKKDAAICNKNEKTDKGEGCVTMKNLRKAGYRGWTALIMRPLDSNLPSAADFKAPQRAKIEGNGYTIIANVGDQQSDLSGGHAERSFKLPNPFYHVP